MLLQLEDDQQFFVETTARFLADKASVATVRGLRDDPAGFGADYWRQGAELGWTSMLVAEEHGGGSVSGLGLVDLSLIAFEFGRSAAPGPLLNVAVVAQALSVAGGHDVLLKELLAGSAIATWAYGEPPANGMTIADTQIAPDGDDLVITGVKRPVESAAQASHLLVTGRSPDGALAQAVVPTDAAGVEIEPMESVDLTRRFFVVHLDGVRVPRETGSVGGSVGPGGPRPLTDAAHRSGASTVEEQVRAQLLNATVIATAESVGAMQTAFDMSVEWASDRYSFGRPLSSYQAIKHRYADMKTWLEASHAIADEAAAAVATGADNGAKLASAAAAYVGEVGSELLQDCVQFHGGIGVTFEHDLHLYLRRHTVNRALFGTPTEHRRIVGELVVAEGSVGADAPRRMTNAPHSSDQPAEGSVGADAPRSMTNAPHSSDGPKETA